MTAGGENRDRWPWTAALAAAVVCAAARATLMAARDGWFVAGAGRLALRSWTRNFQSGLIVCLVSAALFAVLLSVAPARARWLRAFLSLVAGLSSWSFITGRTPQLVFHAPGFDSASARIAHALAALVAIAAAWMLVRGNPRARLLRVAIVAASVGLPLISFSLWMILAFGEKASISRPNVILISLDTVRADRLGCYGYGPPTTPALDRFEKKAVRFESAFSPQPWTLTSHMTLLTSLEPSVHGIVPGRRLSPRVRTLAQVFRDNGYATAAQTDNVVWLDARFGFGRGFCTYRSVYGDAFLKNEAAAALLDDLDAGPFFLFLHYYDAHSDWNRLPYDAAEQDAAEFAGWYRGDCTGCDEHGHCASNYLAEFNRSGRTPSADELRYLSDLYDAGLHGLDRALGELFAALDARGRFDDSIIVVTADHGEEFFEHGRALHGQIYDECVHVPLLVHLPRENEARSSPGVAGLVDVAPTLLELCGIVPPREMQGRSLKPLLSGAEDGHGQRYVAFDAGGTICALRTASYKLMAAGAGWRLFDLAHDPGERVDLCSPGSQQPSILKEIEALLSGERERGAALRAQLEASEPGEGLRPQEIERLRGLGYVDTGN